MRLVLLLVAVTVGLVIWSKSDPIRWLARIPRADWIRYGLPILAGYGVLYVSVTYLNLIFIANEGRLVGILTGPLTAFLVSLLVTVVLQASFVAEAAVMLAASGTISVPIGVALVLGGNIGTCITNTVVSFLSFKDRSQFRNAVAGSVVHDLFNITMVWLILPAELTTGFFSRHVERMAILLGSTSSAPISNIGPPPLGLDGSVSYALLAVIAIAVTLVGVMIVVVNMRKLFVDRMAGALADEVFDSRGKSVACGVGFTFLVQSSSLSTSMIVPLVGNGTVELRRAFYYLLGCNTGTAVVTVVFSLPIILANSTAGTAVALSHLLFNVYGLVLFVVVPPLGDGLCAVAEWIGERVHLWSQAQLIAAFGGFYYLAPALLFWVSWAGS